MPDAAGGAFERLRVFAFREGGEEAVDGFVEGQGMEGDGPEGGAAGPGEGVADAVEEFPGRFVGDGEAGLEVAGRGAGAGGDEEVDGLQPLMQGELGVLEDGADGDGELTEAGRAFPQTGAGGGRLEAADAGCGAVGADRTAGPAAGFEIRAGRVGIGEKRQVGAHDSMMLFLKKRYLSLFFMATYADSVS